MSGTKWCLLALAGSALLFYPYSSKTRASSAFYSIPASRLSHSARAKGLSALPLTFEAAPEPGDDAQFIGRGNGFNIALGADGIRLQFARPPSLSTDRASASQFLNISLVRSTASRKKRRTTAKSSHHRNSHPRKPKSSAHTRKRSRSRSRTSSRAEQSQPYFAWRPIDPLQGQSNYFLGNDRAAWRTRVPQYSAVEAENVLPGVAMKVYGNGQTLEYDLRLDPGIDPATLRLQTTGAAQWSLAENGDLIFRANNGNELRMKKPTIYEEQPDKQATHAPAKPRKLIDGSYVLEADGSIRFAVAPHDASAVLVIDPSLYVAYSTFLGGTGTETAASVALDSSGNVYIAGTTTAPASFSESVSATIGSLINNSGASGSAATNTEYFIAKINPNASGSNSLVYLTFIGGSVSQSGGLIVVDSSGNVDITGTTNSPDFPVTDGSTLTSGSNDVTVSQIDPTGSKLLFSTLFGGSGAESLYAPGGIAADSQGRIYVASDTSSQDLPVTSGVFQSTFVGRMSDGFLAIFQPGASPDLTYCSYLGANANAQIGVGGIAIDAASNVYIAGFSSNAELAFPTKNAFQSTYGGDPTDAFLMAIQPAGQGASDVLYATLLGGSGLDEALAVAVDDSIPANAYVTGTTQSHNFPTHGATAAFQSAFHPFASASAFLSVISQNPSTGVASLAYSTYLGGSASDSGQGIVATAFNSIYVTGSASSWDFPWHDNLQPFNGSQDAFLAKFDPSQAGAASLLYSTPLGGTAPPGLTVSASATAVAADPFGDIYLAGQTTAADFPTAVTASGILSGFQPICASCQSAPALADAFLVALQESVTPQPSVYFNIGSVVFSAQPVGTQNAPQPVAVHNGGEAPLVVSSLQITGPNSSDFSLIGPAACNGHTISVGGECSFEVGFVPSTTGPEAAVVSIADNAPGSPHVLELIGAGQGALASLSTTALNFGSQPENTSSLSLPITITNTGNQALAMQSPVESGTDVAQFFISGKDVTCGTMLAPSASCQIGVVFSPKTIGTFHAQITITDNSGGVTNATQVVSLTGIGSLVAPVASVTPAVIAFGDIVVGSSSGAQSVTISNSGSAPMNLSSIGVAGSNASDFALMISGSSPCPSGGGNLTAGSSCAIGIRFSPASADLPGSKSAVLTIADNAPGNPHTVALSGNATVPPTVQLSPASLTFAPQSDGTSSAAQSITVLNTSTASLAINGITLSGADPADFVETTSCPPSLRAAASCTISVVFAPVFRTAAARSATLNVADNASGSPQTVSLTGTATQASISISPASINFGGEQAGGSSPAQTITVTNNGSGALAFSSIAAAGADFVIDANTCKGASIASGATCTVQLTFSPACTNGTAARTGSLVFADNVPGSPQTVSLTGTATGDFCFAPAGAATVTAGQTAVFSLVVNSPTAYKGTVSLSCAGFPSASTCTVPPTVSVPSQFTVSVATASSNVPVSAPRIPRAPVPLIAAAAFLFVLWFFWIIRARWVNSEKYARQRHRAGAPSSRFLRGWVFFIRKCTASAMRKGLRVSAPAPRVAFPASIRNCVPVKMKYFRTLPCWSHPALIAAALLALSAALAACGGGGSSAAATDPGTPAGTYSLTLTGTSVNTTAQMNLNLTVQ